jgi:hypothetical protein
MNATHWVALGVGVGIGFFLAKVAREVRHANRKFLGPIELIFVVGIAVLAFWMGKR